MIVGVVASRIKEQRKAVLRVVFGGLSIILCYLGLHILGMRLQYTASYPKGIYWLTGSVKKLERGKLVLVCPKKSPIIDVAIEREYLSVGFCESGSVPVIKKLVGLPGESVVVTREGLMVAGVLWPHSQQYRKDDRGRPLPVYSGGVVPENSVFVISDYNSASFDSRYFGPVPVKNIEGYIRPVFTEPF
jgi:conjugative transfer signal peptidase TraF